MGSVELARLLGVDHRLLTATGHLVPGIPLSDEHGYRSRAAVTAALSDLAARRRVATELHARMRSAPLVVAGGLVTFGGA